MVFNFYGREYLKINIGKNVVNKFIINNFFLSDAQETTNLSHILAENAEVGDVFALVGDLGAGKSTLARGFICALTSADEEVPSPTFTLVQSYDHGKIPLWHMDAYRIMDETEVFELGLDEALETYVCLIEWPDRVASVLPPERTVWIKLVQENEGRSIKLAFPKARFAKRTELFNKISLM